jgi:hypothetical protein
VSNYRLIYIGLGLVAVAAIALGVAFGRGPAPEPLPAVVESISPRPNDAVLRQAVIEVDLVHGYRAQIYVNGFLIPDRELVFVEATGVHRWQPTPTSVVLTDWPPGEQQIRIVWDTLVGLPDPGELSWSFRVQ